MEKSLDGVGRAPTRCARKGPRKPRAPGQPRGGGQAYSKLRHQIVTHYNAVTQVCHFGGCSCHRYSLAIPRGLAHAQEPLRGHAPVIPVMHALESITGIQDRSRSLPEMLPLHGVFL